MANYINDLYEYYITSQGDPRVKDWIFMQSPKPALILVIFYLIFVYFGPIYMKNRKPFEMQKLITIYNAFQTLFSCYIVIQGLWHAKNTPNCNILCYPQTYNTDYYSMSAVNTSYLFLLSRFIEFLDTVFLILRKKNNNVTTLHVVHHSTVPLICWVGVKLIPGGHYNFAGVLNSFVHAFMYSYYLLAALGPEYKKYLWWKRYLTILQLIQFVIVILHTIWTIVSGCKVNNTFGYLVLFQAFIFLSLFWQYYREEFEKNKQDSKPLLDFDKYYLKYRKFFEMCIPNQHALLNDNEEENEDKEDNTKSHLE